MHAKGNEIVAKAKEYVGTPWKHQGRKPGVHLDCAGVFLCAAHDLGISDYDSVDYSKKPNKQEFRKHMITMGCTPVVKAEQGDILRIASPKWPVHCGIYEIDDRGQEWVIHAWAVARKTVRQHITPDTWKHVREIMRFPE